MIPGHLVLSRISRAAFRGMRRSSRSEPSLARALSPAADAKSTETPSALRQIEAPSTALG